MFAATVCRAQLPPVAQALYNEMYNADVSRGQYAVNNGAQFSASADGNTFYLSWFPPATTASLTPLVVSLHGSDGNVFNEFYLWHQRLATKGVGIIAVQWWRGASSTPPDDYFDDQTIYTYIDTALSRISYPFNKAMYHGFSRGSARSYAIAFYDRPGVGKNYFCTFLSNSGKPDSLYPLYSQINSGSYGHNLFPGKKWAMFCGTTDVSAQSACWAMNNSKNWVTANGGNVGLYIEGVGLGHGGFHQTPAFIDSALNYYLPCFNVTGIKNNIPAKTGKVYPNPCEKNLSILLPGAASETGRLYNSSGLLCLEFTLKNEETTINTEQLPAGIYSLVIRGTCLRVIKD